MLSFLDALVGSCANLVVMQLVPYIEEAVEVVMGDCEEELVPLYTLFAKMEDDMLFCNLQLVTSEAGMDPKVLCTLSPLPSMVGFPLDWVILKAKAILVCVVISSYGFGDQFRALLIAIEAGCILPQIFFKKI